LLHVELNVTARILLIEQRRLLNNLFAKFGPERLLYFVFYVIITVRQVVTHHLVEVGMLLILGVGIVEVIMFKLGFPLLIVKNFRKLN